MCVQKVSEFSIRVSFLELYNEELFDLLSPRDGRLELFEKKARRTSHGVCHYVHGHPMSYSFVVCSYVSLNGSFLSFFLILPFFLLVLYIFPCMLCVCVLCVLCVCVCVWCVLCVLWCRVLL